MGGIISNLVHTKNYISFQIDIIMCTPKHFHLEILHY